GYTRLQCASIHQTRGLTSLFDEKGSVPRCRGNLLPPPPSLITLKSAPFGCLHRLELIDSTDVCVRPAIRRDSIDCNWPENHVRRMERLPFAPDYGRTTINRRIAACLSARAQCPVRLRKRRSA